MSRHWGQLGRYAAPARSNTDRISNDRTYRATNDWVTGLTAKQICFGFLIDESTGCGGGSRILCSPDDDASECGRLSARQANEATCKQRGLPQKQTQRSPSKWQSQSGASSPDLDPSFLWREPAGRRGGPLGRPAGRPADSLPVSSGRLGFTARRSREGRLLKTR